VSVINTKAIGFPTKLKQGAEFEQNMTISHLIMKRSRSVSKPHCTIAFSSDACFSADFSAQGAWDPRGV